MKPRVLLVGALVCAFAAACFAQDAVKVDPKHYKVESENEKVRVLRIHYGPHEKSVMHSHPASVVIYLTDAKTSMTTPDGKSQVVNGKAGEARYIDAGSHLPENAGDKDFDAILVELKTPKAAPKK